MCELKACLDSSDFPTMGGNKPLCACGTQFISHKVCALERVLDRFGAYMNHLVTLTEDPKTKSADREKLRGYIKKMEGF